MRRNICCEYKNKAIGQLRRDTSTSAGDDHALEPHGQQLPSPSPSTLAGPGRSEAPVALETPCSPKVSDIQPSTASIQSDSPALNLTDLELLHAWQNSTAPSISTFVSRIASVLTFWRVSVPEIGFSHPFVLHAVLALSAIHLSRFKRGREQFYKLESERHWNQGFAMTTSQIPQVNDESYHAFFVFSMMSCMYKLAKGPTPGDFLAFSEPGHDPPEWIIYYKGYHSFMILGIDAMRHGPLAELIETASLKTRRFFAQSAELADPDPIADLRRLCDEALGSTEGGAQHAPYNAAIDNLARCFTIMFSGEHDGEFNLTIWALNIPQDFIPCIQQREPMALVIFAYFVALLNELSAWWVLDGWVNHLMSGIWNALSAGRRNCIRWPMERTGWLPP